MSRYVVRTKHNVVLVLFVIVMNLLALIVAPLFWSPLMVGLFLVVDVMVVRLTNIHWHLIHEAVHGVLAKPRWLNECLGNVLGILFNSSFAALRQGHLTHHRVNRVADVAEVYYQKDKPGKLAYYFEILGGFFLVFCFIFPLLSLFGKPFVLRVIARFEKKNKTHPSYGLYASAREMVMRSRIVSDTRWQISVALLFLVLSVVLYSSQGLFWMWLVYFLVRAALMSYANNMPHYRNDLNDVDASDQAYLPKVLARCYLNFNYHHTHHLHPRAPWHQLPKLFQADGGEFDCRYIQSYFSQLRGPVFHRDLIDKAATQ